MSETVGLPALVGPETGADELFDLVVLGGVHWRA